MFDEQVGQLDEILKLVLNELDIPEELLEEAESRYKELAEWLKNDSETRYKSNALLYPQGSMLLGTTVRPVKAGDDYDFDFVYRRDIKKESITQADLKKQVGDQLKEFIKHLEKNNVKEIPTLKVGNRCWTLMYGKKFHMDVLPALPEPDGSYSFDQEDAIIITDKNLHEWQSSNPKGFAKWFRKSTRVSLSEKLAKAHVEIEDLPEEGEKTTLQRAVQILKRHRDLVYTGHPDDKPISVIITTLAGQAYNKSDNIYSVLKGILENMEKFIDKKKVSGEEWVENPINPKENFADKWNDAKYPKRKTEFYTWLKKAQDDFLGLETKSGIIQLSEGLKKSLGDKEVTAAFEKYGQKTFDSRKSGNLKVNTATGVIGTVAGVGVKAHTFFGDDEV